MKQDMRCAQCGNKIEQMALYTDHKGFPLGEWPLYFFGAKTVDVASASAYMCGAKCANKYIKEHRDAT